MISPKVNEIVDGFIQRAGKLFTHRAQQLDNTWPSVGLLDSITFLLRDDQPRTPEQEVVIRATAGYIGRIAARCWERFGAEVKLDIDDTGIYIAATKGPQIPNGETFRVEIERLIDSFLRTDPSPLAVFADLERPMQFDYPRLNVFAHGLMFAICPHGNGAWAGLEPANFKNEIAEVEKELAADCARWYERVHPTERLGQVAELYLQHAVYPPTLYGEKFPLRFAAEGLAQYIEEQKLAPTSLKSLATNLARSADERLSSLGLALYAAVIDELPSLELIVVGETKGPYASLLRGAAMVLRTELKLGSDWLLNPNHKEDIQKRFRIERALGFHPWLTLPPKYVASAQHEEKLFELVRAVSNLQLKDAITAAEQILLDTPNDLDVRVQRIFLDIMLGDTKKMDKSIRSLLTEPGAESIPDIYDLWATVASMERDLPRCVERLAKAYSLVSDRDERFVGIASRYARSLFAQQNYTKCLQVLSQIREPRFQPLDTLGMKMQAHFLLNQTADWSSTCEQIQNLAPTFRGLMSLLIAVADSPKKAN